MRQSFDDPLEVLEVAGHRADLADQAVQRVAQLVRDGRIDHGQQHLLCLRVIEHDLVRDVNDLDKQLGL